MFSALLDLAKRSPVNSVETVVADWFILIRITDLHCAKYAQTTQSAIDTHQYPLDKHVIKAFIPTGWKFHDSKGVLICIHSLNSNPQEFPKKLKVIFQIQKNRQNGQSITLVADNAHPEICPI